MKPTTTNAAQIVLGAAVVVVGAGFLLDGLDVLNFGQIAGTWWPVLIILAGLASLLSAPSAPLWPVGIMAIGTLLLLNRLEVTSINVWQLIWPVAVIFFGLSLIFSKMGRPAKAVDAKSGSDLFVAFSGIEHRNTSPDYKGGTLQALFGGITLDLRDASIKRQATLHIFAGFGGVDLTVPKGWQVQVSGLPLLGGVENKTNQTTDKGAPVLHVRANCFCGGVSIKN